jgi:hypothetical protein
LLASAVYCLVTFSGCTGHFYKVPTPTYDTQAYQEVATDSVTATGIMLFGFIPIGQNDKIHRAIEQLLAKNNGDALTDIEIQERWFWAYILNGYKVEVAAKVLKKN